MERRNVGPSKLCAQEGPCKHHGPNSFHATSECRDPTLSKRKQTDSGGKSSNTPVSSLTDVAAVSPSSPSSGLQTSTFYSPMFVARTSKASMRYPRARFTTSSNFARHFCRGRQRPQRRCYDVKHVKPGLMDECIRAYVSPVRGYMQSRGSICALTIS